ncbi:unnamed protein product [Phytophthora lilii]|uniref:Unnamed protein product n=1 Tax=Phytophthora lilii TaxID=2077276 RepID=A0A9W6THF1_9STRA|nr:unnamed protein product [Phytophthora lilii]
MKYLDAELLQTDTIEQLYDKLVVLMNHLADELKPIVARQSKHFSVHTPTPSGTGTGNGNGNRDGESDGEGNEYDTDPMLMMEIAMCGDMSYYVELLEQGAEFFSVCSLIACLKLELVIWEDYPLFEGSGVDFGAEDDDEGLLLDESDDNYGPTSDSLYSNTSYQSSSSLARSNLLSSSLSGDSHGVNGAAPSAVPSSLVEPLVSYRGGRYVNMGDTSYDIADEMASLERRQSGLSLNSSSSPASSETHSTFRRLLSHSSLLRRGGLTSALPIRRGLVQKPGDPYISSGGVNSSMPTNTLEQAILGGGGTGTGGSSSVGGTSLGTSQGNANGGGIIAGSTNPVAAEMMATSMKRQERDDGFALPVFQWSKRFYRSLEQQEAKQKAIAAAGSADTSGVSTHSPASSRGGGASPANGRRRSIDQQANHALFMRVDREENEEQNDFSELWGLRSWPAVFCYPEGSSPPLAHWPNIVSLIMDNRSALDSARPV